MICSATARKQELGSASCATTLKRQQVSALPAVVEELGWVEDGAELTDNAVSLLMVAEIGERGKQTF